MIVADANLVIAATNPSDVHHEDARQIVRQHRQDGITLHSLTMAEVLVGPARAGEHLAARRTLERAGFGLASAGEPEPEAVAAVRAQTALKMPDACVLALAEHLDSPLASFDRRLARAARARGLAVEGDTP